MQKHERDHDSQPSHRVCVCTVHATLLSGQQQVEWKRKESGSRSPKKSTTTTGVVAPRQPSCLLINESGLRLHRPRGHYFRDINRFDAAEHAGRNHQSRQQQQASSSTTGSHQQEKHTSQEQVLKQPFHPHHHTGSAYCTVHATLLARYINRCPRGGREGRVDFWRCKKPPSITSPSQNFGTAQKPLPRVEDSE